MIVCPNCNHQNPEGATQCEACYTPLPTTISCPNCGATVQADASFCGQCGFQLKTSAATEHSETPLSASPSEPPEMVVPDPLVEPEPIAMSSQPSNPELGATPSMSESGSPIPQTSPPSPPDPTIASTPEASEVSEEPEAPEPVTASEAATSSSPPSSPPAKKPASAATQLQLQSAQLLHLQTNTKIELPENISVIHLGKPNDKIPPDIDVSGFPDSEIVSRIHADIRVEGDIYYIEDVGSSNGTYINHIPLPPGNRHRLRSGDRISLGKGDKMTFLFKVS